MVFFFGADKLPFRNFPKMSSSLGVLFSGWQKIDLLWKPLHSRQLLAGMSLKENLKTVRMYALVHEAKWDKYLRRQWYQLHWKGIAKLCRGNWRKLERLISFESRKSILQNLRLTWLFLKVYTCLTTGPTRPGRVWLSRRLRHDSLLQFGRKISFHGRNSDRTRWVLQPGRRNGNVG